MKGCSRASSIEAVRHAGTGRFGRRDAGFAHPASALAAGSAACIQAMANKARMQGISAAKILETLHIVRFALATKVIGEAEPIFDVLQDMPQ